MTKAKQAQRVLIKGKQMIGLEQTQSVVGHDLDTWQDSAVELYHQCKLLGKPVIPAVCKELYDIALREEPTKREAARVLGIRESTLYNTQRRLKGGTFDHFKRWVVDDDS